MQNIIELSINLTEIGSITVELSNPELDFVQKTGVKLIKGATTNSYIQISIIDNGIGLQENEIEGIFEPYTQVDKLNKKNIVRSFCVQSKFSSNQTPLNSSNISFSVCFPFFCTKSLY